MKILLTSIGSRGDMEPFLAIAQILKPEGHDLICLFPEQFEELVIHSGLRFASLGSEFLDMLDSEDGKAALGGSGGGIKKLVAYIRLASRYRNMNKGLVLKQQKVIDAEAPDLIIHNGKATYPVIWGIKNGFKNILVSPVPYLHYVKGHAHLAFNANFGPVINKFTFKIAKWGLVSTINASLKWLGKNDELSKSQISNALETAKTLYTISPTLFPRPEYWSPQLQVVGYHERDQSSKWSPDDELREFCDKHKKLLLLTFGSMTNPYPEEKTQLFIDVLSELEIPAIINTASGGLAVPKEYNKDQFHFVNRIPYDWIFPKMYAVIHHGGSGTTHTALKHGCVTMIVPHIIDQFVWNKMIFRIGAGPKGPRIDRLNKKELMGKVQDLWTNISYKNKAREIGAKMSNENMAPFLLKEITTTIKSYNHEN